MRRLSSIIVFAGLSLSLFAQSPHGEELRIDCAACHNTSGWSIPESWRLNTPASPTLSNATGWVMDQEKRFDHTQTDYPLSGQHTQVECKDCHESLIFSQASQECISCHTDMHNQTVGTDCARCHTPEHWLVDNISQLHFENGFPLVGAHSAVNCYDCHTSETALRFDRIGNECVNCHLNDYETSTKPNHENAGFSKDCSECHDVFRFDWTTELVNHDFFPLTLGHDIQDCARCHTSGNFSDTPTECVACHQVDFNNSLDPNHQAADFSTDCASCHTTDPGWMPAEFLAHDLSFFPIYSGSHEGEWEKCSECHTNSSDYAVFSCIICHLNPETDEGHDGVYGYIYEDPACLACHPTGSAEDNFDHNTTNFPLTGAHLQTACIECHANGFAGTPMECSSCHEVDFNETINPNHVDLGLSMDCATCHTTDPGWMPALFPNHNDFYQLNGAHADIANDCASCHNGDYNNTPNTCAGCHLEDFNAATDPDHQAANFSTDCASCHTEDSWTPATFDHDGQFFPIYSGEHNGEWDQCSDCHTNPNDFSEFTCITCHTNPGTDNEHDGVNGYSYNSPACLACHPTGSADDNFNHSDTDFPLTGAHTTVACIECHAAGYQGTPTDCAACHETDFNQTNNPDHNNLGLPMDCAMCHTTQPGWMPAQFPLHDNFYELNGAHANIANDCAACHNGDYNNTPNTCAGCHIEDYNQTTDPDHGAAMFSTDCATCHSESSWIPSTFDHDGQYFPIYSGEHNGEWDQCTDCHTDPSDYSIFTCITCHTNPGTDNEHDGVNGYSYNSPACLACHPTGSSDFIFDHNTTGFQLTGGHSSAECVDCHAAGFQGTPTECLACHETEFNQTSNPNHSALGFATDCASCHTTDPGWNPALLANHDDFYQINGAHLAIANDCGSCHNGNYNNTPNTCSGCHSDDYNQTTNPDHQAAQFPTDCATCHTEDSWVPSTFDHSAYFPFTGAHIPIAEDCNACHNGNYTNTPNTCDGCHTEDYNQTTNPNHQALGLPTDCATCHTTDPGWEPATFPIHDDFYPLNGAHIPLANDCAVCHNGNYNNTPNTCYGCHQDDYDQTTNPGHLAAQFPTDCQSCHTENAWVPTTFDHDGQYFPIYSGEHNGEWSECMDCHTNPMDFSVFTCTTCHANPETDNQHDGVGGYSYNSPACLACHPTGSANDNFDHNNTSFPLTGAHTSADCIDCHSAGYQGTPTDCYACHTMDYDLSANPGHVALAIPTECATCHTTQPGWEPATFPIHDNFYPLTGAHAPIANDCATCHNGNYNNTPNTCVSCHAADYDQSTNPNHGQLGIPSDCAMCHTTDPGWEPATFPIHDDYYPLNGAHVTLANDCAVCHNGNYNNTPNTCAGCHIDDYNQTTNPDHQAAQFPTDCATCHTETAWTPSTFDHEVFFPFTGAHIPIAEDCAACHNGNYNNTPNTCEGCHTDDYNQTSNPNHLAIGIPNACATCHTTEPGWAPATFPIHDDYYTLNGAHLNIANDCEVCHNGNYNNTPNTCEGCHIDDYNQTTNPDHQAAQFPTDCASCHSEVAWTPSTFNHNAYYPFTGAHIPIANDCNACHNGNYNNTPNTCDGCHTGDYAQSTNPNHAALNLPTDCEMCHTTSPNWEPATFPIHNNYYQLIGAHAGIANDCDACHNGNYNNTPNTCYGCHIDDYVQTINPPHLSAQFPTDCEDCHTQVAWVPSTFNHNVYYPFTGAHIPIANDCNACHNGNYNNTPNTCQGCHTPDYISSTNPNHQALGIPMDCAMCHTTAPDWNPATFPIHNNYYPLLGAHAGIANDCDACHNGNYNNTPNTCYGCHATEYNQTNDPDHQAAQFPTNCESCHTQNAWTPSTWDHDSQYFPIFSGKHNNEWDQCIDCHTVAGNYTLFSCIDCHEHDNPVEVGQDHNGVNNYSYNSQACYNCHPNGSD